MDLYETGVVNPQASHHNVTADGARRPPWDYNRFHILQHVTLGVATVLLPYGLDTPTKRILKSKLMTPITRAP